MTAMLTRRNVVLGLLLLGTLAVSAWTLLDRSNDAVVEPVVRPARTSAAGAAVHGAPPPAGTTELRLLQRPGAPAAPVDLFGAYSYQPPAATPGATPAQKPHAPPLPFTYTGHLEIDGQSTYLFLQADVPVGITVGSAIGDFTLVQAVGQTLVFLHGPTGERVSMPTGAAVY
jgi:hypothetical protein